MTGYLVIDNGEWWIVTVDFDHAGYDMVIPIKDILSYWIQASNETES